jgi:hypothetical protein
LNSCNILIIKNSLFDWFYVSIFFDQTILIVDF